MRKAKNRYIKTKPLCLVHLSIDLCVRNEAKKTIPPIWVSTVKNKKTEQVNKTFNSRKGSYF